MGDLWSELKLIEAFSLRRLVNVVAPVDVRMCALNRLNDIASHVDSMKCILPLYVCESAPVWLIQCFDIVWRRALDDVDGDE